MKTSYATCVREMRVCSCVKAKSKSKREKGRTKSFVLLATWFHSFAWFRKKGAENRIGAAARRPKLSLLRCQ